MAARVLLGGYPFRRRFGAFAGPSEETSVPKAARKWWGGAEKRENNCCASEKIKP